MKKGLLSLLAVALTVVSCQNYDDQFQSLTDQITELSSTVQGLTVLEGQVAALQQTVNGLATSQALAALAGVVTTNGAAIAANGTAIAANGTAIAANGDAVAANGAAVAANGAAVAANGAAVAANGAAVAANGVAVAANGVAVAANGAAVAANGVAVAANGTAIAGNLAAINSVATSIASVQASLTAINDALALVATSADLLQVSNTLGDVQDDVKEILAGNATINQDITITNAATLEYAETLVGTTTEDPNVIVNGQVTINMTNIDAADLPRVNQIAAKLATILGDGAASGAKKGLIVTSDTALTFTNLVFIDDDYTIAGSDQDDASLLTVSGDLSIDHGGAAAAIDYSTINTVGGDVIIAAADVTTATSVDFSNVIIDGNLNGGTLNFENATTVDLGSVSFTSLTANKAQTIVSGQAGTAATFTIIAGNGGTVTVNSLETVTGALSLSGSTTTDFFLNGVESAGSLTVTNSANSHFTSLADAGVVSVTADAAVNLPALVASSGATEINADNVILTGLVSITHTFDLNAVATLDVAALTNVINTLTIDNGPINLPTAQFTGLGLLSTTATTVTVGGSDDLSLDNVAVASVDYLTLASQQTSVTLAAAAANLVSLNVTTSEANGSTSDLTVPSAATLLTELTATGFDVVTVGAAGAGTAIVTMTTAGTTRDVVLTDNAALVSLDLGHTYDASYTDAQVVNIINNDALTSVDLTSVARLEAARITGNLVLATITAPNGDNPLTPGATASFTIKANALTATYTFAEAARQDGIANVPYTPATLEQASLSTWKAYFADIAVTNTVSFSLDYDFNGAGAANNFAADAVLDTASNATPTFAGLIDTDAELAIVN